MTLDMTFLKLRNNNKSLQLIYLLQVVIYILSMYSAGFELTTLPPQPLEYGGTGPFTFVSLNTKITNHSFILTELATLLHCRGILMRSFPNSNIPLSSIVHVKVSLFIF